MNLFLIGNGFDSAHKLPTKYEDFQKYLIETYPKALENNPSFSISSTMMPDGEIVYDINEVVAFLMDIVSKAEEDGEKWSDVETSLGKLDFEEYFDDMSYLYNEDEEDFNFFHQAYDYEDVSSNFFSVTIMIKQLFAEWIDTINIEAVDPIISFKNTINPDEDYFINFNYTPVLEEIYDAKNVFHIHGEQSSEIIFGHGVFKENFENNYVGTEFNLANIHNSLRKNTDQVIEQWSEMFHSLKNIKSIYSYGFSFSQVDLPYIKEICKVIDTKNITWYLNDYNYETTGNVYIERIKSCGFKGDFSIFST
ncbi:bacteriophage abortive infection AbiH family protein [Lysinibacillus fusiformis]|uniref:bacteriophage abortive infection AbiH family protein n=1 Tax=Lysinibacillus fusiformis TaxID=28031 RepID=UPI0035C04A83|nr:bacteriophage abortive infection AbiH family protein [Lysinibacillus fusiformis]